LSRRLWFQTMMVNARNALTGLSGQHWTDILRVGGAMAPT
jgi:hypothetical protein